MLAVSSRWVAWVLAAPVLAALIGTAAYFLTRDHKGHEDAKPAVDAVAVLPFEYAGKDPKTEELSETLADHIIESLRQVRRRDFHIRPFSSVARYTRQRPDNLTIGQALNVPLLVTGTIRQTGEGDLKITVEVVDARTDNLLWSNYYRGKRGGVLDLDTQDRIVRDVAANLGLQLSDEEQQRLTRRRTPNPEAYQFYREAMYHFNKFSPAGFTAAIASCRQALKWLRAALEERDSQVIWVKLDPTLKNLHSDPRFAEVLKEMGLPP